MADRVSGTITQATAKVRTSTDISPEQLAEELREAQAS